MVDFIVNQLNDWQLAANNYADLRLARHKYIIIGDLELKVAFNPARSKSTCAKTSAEEIAKRECFLCSANRPIAQKRFGEILNNHFEVLLNPFPICNPHFTVVSLKHVPQTYAPIEMLACAANMPGMVAFFNGANAGASAPDHLHFQMVKIDELPLLKLIENAHAEDKGSFMLSTDMNISLPISLWSFIIKPDKPIELQWKDIIRFTGHTPNSLEPHYGLVNLFVWIDDNGNQRVIVIPRLRHRPEIFFALEPKTMYISPGALDVAGLIVTVREQDYTRVNREIIEEVYQETTLSKADFLKFTDKILNIE